MSHRNLKLLVLEALESGEPMRPGDVAVAVGYYPMRGLWPYLKRLQGFGLLLRGKDAMGQIQYSISQRGVERLAYLRRQ